MDAELTLLDQPDFNKDIKGVQFQHSESVKALNITAKSRSQYGASVIKRWEAGTVKDGRSTLFGKDIRDDVPDSALFYVTREGNSKRESAKPRFDLILKGECRTVGEYRRMVGARQANDDIAWDINHDFYSLMVPQ